MFHEEKKRWNSYLNDDDLLPKQARRVRSKHIGKETVKVHQPPPRFVRIRYHSQGLISRIIWGTLESTPSNEERKKLDNDYSNNPEIENEREKKYYTLFRTQKADSIEKKKVVRTFGFIRVWVVDGGGEEEGTNNIIHENI